MGRKLENKNATSTEIEMYRYAGIYLVKTTENSLEYAPVHFRNSTNDFPFVIEDIEDDMIEWDCTIIFDKMSETVLFQGENHFYDADVLAMIVRRTEELQFEKPIFDGIFEKREDKGPAKKKKRSMTLKDLNEFAKENGIPEDTELFVFGHSRLRAVTEISTESLSKDALYKKLNLPPLSKPQKGFILGTTGGGRNYRYKLEFKE